MGPTTLKAGESGTVRLLMRMGQGMDGPHLFRVRLFTNDPLEPEKDFLVRVYFG